MKKIIVAAVLVLAGCINDVNPDGSGKTTALIIGVENGFAGDCGGALKDAEDMTALLSQYTTDITVLKDRQATASAVLAAMGKAVRSDLAIIYFSGHGGSLPSSDEFETDGKDEFICCYDKGLLDDKIWKTVCEARGRVFLIFDCCHSETMFRSPGISFSIAGRRLSGSSSVRMLCWSGCPDESYSYGSASGGEFTMALRKYASNDRTYAEVWEKISTDRRLMQQQTVKATLIGSFDINNAKIFR